MNMWKEDAAFHIPVKGGEWNVKRKWKTERGYLALYNKVYNK